MDEVRIVRRHSRIWIGIAIAIIIVALIVLFVLFGNQFPVTRTGLNGVLAPPLALAYSLLL
jgi:hypothetical protein